jgi:3-hydroxymyristoyl/3-hydroxydecanoyl-(acyl carrier protein) dehydratase
MLLHNINNIDQKNNDLSYDEYKFKTKLEPNKLYKVKYTIVTNNGLKVEKLSKELESNEKIPSDLYKCKIIASSNYDNGAIEIKVIPPAGELGLGI